MVAKKTFYTQGKSILPYNAAVADQQLESAGTILR